MTQTKYHNSQFANTKNQSKKKKLLNFFKCLQMGRKPSQCRLNQPHHQRSASIKTLQNHHRKMVIRKRSYISDGTTLLLFSVLIKDFDF
jgi:hypothetical protein